MVCSCIRHDCKARESSTFSQKSSLEFAGGSEPSPRLSNPASRTASLRHEGALQLWTWQPTSDVCAHTLKPPTLQVDPGPAIHSYQANSWPANALYAGALHWPRLHEPYSGRQHHQYHQSPVSGSLAIRLLDGDHQIIRQPSRDGS
jgi:hypothetical protein